MTKITSPKTAPEISRNYFHSKSNDPLTYQVSYNSLESFFERKEEERKQRELRLLALPIAAEKVHDETFQYLKQKLPNFVDKRRVFIDPEMQSNGGLLPKGNYKLTNIAVSVPIGNLSKSYLYLTAFYDRNPGSSPEDLLRYILTHEYAHILEEDPQTYYGYDSPFRDQWKYGLKGFETTLSEAFAFWFSDAFTDFKLFSREVAEAYSRISNPDMMQQLFQVFVQEQKRHGRRHVVENKDEIAKKELLRR